MEKTTKDCKKPIRKSVSKKKPTGFEMMKSFQKKIEKSYTKLQTMFNICGEDLNTYIYEGKKKNAATARACLMDISKETKILRTLIQEAKVKLKPVYKKE